MVKQKIKENDLAVAFVAYEDVNHGKKRPVFIAESSSSTTMVLKITSQYANKSPRIKKQLYEVKDWQQSGLAKPSWIDVSKIIKLSNNDFTLSKIGTLTTNDKRGLSSFIDDYSKRERLKILDQEKNLAYLNYLKNNGLER